MGYKSIKKMSKDGNMYYDYCFVIEHLSDWLHTKGGRSLSDVMKDEKGAYIPMTTFDRTNKLYIPTRYLV